MKILLVEDNKGLAELVKQALTYQHYLVEWVADGQRGWELADQFEYDLIVLDLMLPGLDGFNFCQRRRAAGDRTPILLMTALGQAESKIAGLDAGADDYIVKPFDLQEFLARIRALLRWRNLSSPPILEWGDLRLDLNGCKVTCHGNPVPLTAKEYDLLELFLRHRQRIFSKRVLLDRLWISGEIPSETAVRTHIKGLRHKLKQAGAGDVIETVYGLGYRLQPDSSTVKPLKTETRRALSNKTSNETAEPAHQPVSLDLVGIWEKHKSHYLNRIQVLEQAVSALQVGIFDETLQQQFYWEAHTLKGSLGSFGFENASKLAYQIEQVLQGKTGASKVRAERLSQLIRSLRDVLNQPPTRANVSISQPEPMASVYQLLIADDDAALAEQLKAEAANWGIRGRIATNPLAVREAVDCARPDVVLLDLGFPTSVEEGFGILAELTAAQPPIPTLVITGQEDFTNRVKAAQLGAQCFLQKPIQPAQVMEAVTQVLEQGKGVEAKLLIVDDDPQMLDLLRTMLQPWGFQLTLLADPQQFWSVLEQTAPDVLVLDEKMPQLSGVDLCRVVRNAPDWQDLPVLFLSGCRDMETVQQVFAAGADDYIAKPIVEPELIARVLSRLERAQWQRRLAETDSLTGTSNRRKLVQELNRLLQLARRQQQSLCLMLLDLDYFKRINDTYGHAIGDEVLTYLGQLLKQTFRSEDTVGRWGGEEFAIALYGATREQGAARLRAVLEQLHQHPFVVECDRVFQISFSAGVAAYPDDGTDLNTLYQAVDKALYQAKAAGRNQVAIFCKG